MTRKNGSPPYPSKGRLPAEHLHFGRPSALFFRGLMLSAVLFSSSESLKRKSGGTPWPAALLAVLGPHTLHQPTGPRGLSPTQFSSPTGVCSHLHALIVHNRTDPNSTRKRRFSIQSQPTLSPRASRCPGLRPCRGCPPARRGRRALRAETGGPG